MLVVITGAGASFDSVDPAQDPDLAERLAIGALRRPPLASELFDGRRDHVAAMNGYPELSPHIPRLRGAASLGGEALEVELRTLQEESERLPVTKRSLMAMRFYLRRILDEPITDWLDEAGGATNYGSLLYQLAVWRETTSDEIVWITFNYDVMLERAATAVFGTAFETMDEYVSDSRLKLIYPHGYVRWVEPIQTWGGNGYATSESEIISGAEHAAASGQYQFREHAVGAPALAIPVDATKQFVLPEDHLETMRNALATATRILIIGWRGAEKHFHALLQQCPAVPCAIVDATTDAIAAVRLNLMNGRVSFASGGQQLGYPGGFSAFVRDKGVDRWLDGRIAGDPPGGMW